MADPSKFLEINNNDDALTTAKKINSNFKKLLDNSISTRKKVLSIDGLSQMAKDTAEQAHSVSSDALLTAISAETLVNQLLTKHLTVMTLPVDPRTIEPEAGALISAALVAVTENNKLEKISRSAVNTAGTRLFSGDDHLVEGETVTGERFPLMQSIISTDSLDEAWDIDTPCTAEFYDYHQRTWASMKYPIGEYYDNVGSLVQNTTPPSQGWQLFIGGLEGPKGYFRPTEYSFSLRDDALVYKAIGMCYDTFGGIAILSEQPVFISINGIWRNYDSQVAIDVTTNQNNLDRWVDAMATQKREDDAARASAAEAASVALAQAQKDALDAIEAAISAHRADVKAITDAIAKDLLDEKTVRSMFIRPVYWQDENGNYLDANGVITTESSEYVLLYTEIGRENSDFLQRQSEIGNLYFSKGVEVSSYGITEMAVPKVWAKGDMDGTAVTMGTGPKYDWIAKSNGNLSLKVRSTPL